MSDINCVIPNLKKFNLSCPFTWGLRAKFEEGRGLSRMLGDYKSVGIPLISVIACIVGSYESMDIDNNETVAREWLEEAEISLTECRKDKETSDIAKAVEHILQGTAMYIFHTNGRTNELKDMCEKIVEISELNELEQAALEGCKSFALLLCPKPSFEELIALTKKAIAGNGRNPLWHFAYGHCLRKQRKLHDYTGASSSLEFSNFKTADECSTHAFYKIHYIQARHEHTFGKPRSNFEEMEFADQQMEMFKQVLPNCGNQPLLLLKVALGMLRCKYYVPDLNIVHFILDRVDELSKENSASFHYRGCVYKHQRDYMKAMEYLKRAAETCNFAADSDYFQCMVALHRSTSDLIKFSMDMLEKYESYYAERLQQILLNLVGLYYLHWDVKNSAKYMLQAIEMSPDSQQLKRRHRVLSVYMETAYDFLRRKLLPNCRPRNDVDDNFGESVRKLRHYALKNI